MTYIESIEFLYNLQKFGMKFGLNGIRTLLRFLDNPEKQFLSVHIAGTNGKGSTASMIASIFTAAGYKTGLFTSPHLVSFNERIRINGKPISARAVTKLTSIVRPEVKKNNSTFFEAVTAMAFKHFADSKVDIAVIETGLGGRLDATNVLKPLVSVITTIGLDHTYILGSKITDIAYEKGGIIKRGVPCITGTRSGKSISVLRTICKKKKSRFIRVRSSEIRLKKITLDGITGNFFAAGRWMKNVKVSLTGEHQALNTSMAVKTVEEVVRREGFKIGEESIKKGLGNICKYSGLQARLSVLQKKPLVLADVGHNPEAISSLCRSLRRLKFKKLNIVFGLMQDKDYRQILRILKPVTHTFFAVQAKTERSRNAAELAEELRRLKVPVKEFINVKHGLKEAIRQSDGLPVLITGSHFVVGEAITSLKNEKYLTINQ
ncbi:MAG: bifunctional folylpolyglutamate synthase/dihydrofolate synthase [Bacteroidetes bacterium]|nr:bifunctional folylpolyglutamate synthase/dihydrofolate synthase [Bacteroidota bacterium]